MRKPTTGRERRGAGRAARLAQDLTAGDLARLLLVDLKTIHNWVNQGYVFARRTEGRHLRFQRGEVVRFLRRFGYAVPAAIGRGAPRVLSHLGKRRASERRPGADERGERGLFSTVLEVAGGAYEVLVVELDVLERSLARELVAALRSRAETRGLAVIGLSRHAARRADFVRSGGDVALGQGRPADVVRATRFVTGGAAAPPKGALVAG